MRFISTSSPIFASASPEIGKDWGIQSGTTRSWPVVLHAFEEIRKASKSPRKWLMRGQIEVNQESKIASGLASPKHWLSKDPDSVLEVSGVFVDWRASCDLGVSGGWGAQICHLAGRTPLFGHNVQ